MDTKSIAYIIYLAIMMINGIVLAESHLSFRDWQFWVLLFNFVIVYLCGYVRGG